jgi:hypothetical protein
MTIDFHFHKEKNPDDPCGKVFREFRRGDL